MKSIGPYVAARELPGRTGSPVRTLRATDRLTGMPVLLHVLPHPPALPALPEHPNVLPVVDSGVDGEHGYLVTELPLQARPASDALLTARGALGALAALHGQGVVHGGLSPAQLWSVDGQVLVAGAGLPWGGDPGPADDLYALAVILSGMGPLPAALRPLAEQPGTLSAAQALSRLNATPGTQGAATSGSRAAQAPAEPAAPPAPPAGTSLPEPSPSGTEPATDVPAPSAPVAARLGGSGGSKRGRRNRAGRPAEPVTPAPPSSAPDSPAGGAAGPALSAPAPFEWRASRDRVPPDPVTPVGAAHDGSPIILGEAEAAVADLPGPVDGGPAEAGNPDGTAPDGPGAAAPEQAAAPLPTQPDLPAPLTGGPPAPAQPETPQERRRRQNEERRAQAMLDAQAAAARKAERLRTERARQTEQAAQPGPVRIGFSGAEGEDLPAWTPAGEERGEEGTPRRLNLRDVERLPPGLRRAPLPEPEPEIVTRLPARRAPGDPIRIGWDEDDSWRVVREAPAPPPVRSRWPRWALLAALALLIAGTWWALRGSAVGGPVTGDAASGPGGTVSAFASDRPSPAAPAGGADSGAPCCPVEFVVKGAGKVQLALTVQEAPADANLTPGQEFGSAPGRVLFPVRGAYRLNVRASGYAPATLNVTVPHPAPLVIDLGK
ncbi:hypothetical protein [Deinococcus depolymerans]|uniref:PEGA domain-containing protein n=1 Tax=Deinococcus depolymerans TaxID=392408 RepID=A0ABN1CF94_9DEIO